MSSKAFYKRAAPRLVRRLKVPSSSSNKNDTNTASCNSMIEVWITTCIVTNFGKTLLKDTATTATAESSGLHHDSINNNTTSATTTWTLLNPSNPGLTGCRNFPYFPRGGPVPATNVASAVHRDWQPLGFASAWGGMDVGRGMMFPATVVDGLVHLRGGWPLRAELQWLRSLQQWNSRRPALLGGRRGDDSNDSDSSNVELCPVGRAVRTSAAGELEQNYDAIVHTTPPFYQHYDGGHPETALAQCYASALSLATAAADDSDDERTRSSSITIATPLLGAGCRGFPEDVACRVAARAVVSALQQSATTQSTTTTLAFGMLEEATAAQLVEALQEAVDEDDDNEQ